MFKSYSRGIFNDPNCNGKLNHAGLAVGYNLNGKLPYIEVKNAWGKWWGDNGYYKMAINLDTNRNIC